MANRIVGNIYIIDSQQAATVPLAWPSNAKIATVAFWSGDTSGRLIMTMGGNSNNAVISMGHLVHGQAASGNLISITPATQWGSFSPAVYFDQLAVATLTAGTAWLYMV